MATDRTTLPDTSVDVPLLAPGRTLRFAARAGDRCSRYWVLRSMRWRPDVYLSRQGTGRWLHLSLHGSLEHWHYKVTGREGTVITQPWRPAQRPDGALRAVVLDFRAASLTEEVSPDSKVDLWLGDVTETSSLLVELFLVDAAWAVGTVRRRLRPAGHDAVLPGGLRLSDGRAVLIVASDAPASTGSTSVPRVEWTHDDLEAAEQAAARGELRMMIFGAMSDGALGLLDLRAPPGLDVDRMASNPRRRSGDE